MQQNMLVHWQVLDVVMYSSLMKLVCGYRTLLPRLLICFEANLNVLPKLIQSLNVVGINVI